MPSEKKKEKNKRLTIVHFRVHELVVELLESCSVLFRKEIDAVLGNGDKVLIQDLEDVKRFVAHN
jgi:hypothetical protein